MARQLVQCESKRRALYEPGIVIDESSSCDLRKKLMFNDNTWL